MRPQSKPVLGEITAFTITAPDLEKSLAFYKNVGFSEIMRDNWPFPWIQVSDGVLLIMLREDPKPYIALTYYVKKIDEVVKSLEQKGIVFTGMPKPKDMVKRYLFQSPDGLNISLVNIMDGFSQPKGPGMLSMPQEDYFRPEKYVNKTIGLFGELAHPVADLEKSVDFWKLLGFNEISAFSAPYPWAILSDGLSIVGLHQSNHFSFPAITYFASDMGEKIKRLKDGGLTGYTDEGAGNIKITTPEQQHFFLFSMGMPAEVRKKQAKDIKQPIIETQRLRLREVDPAIMNELFTQYPDEEIIKFLGLRSPEELEIHRDNFKQGMTTYRISYKVFYLEEKDSGRIIGKCGFHNWYRLHSRSEIGYEIFDEADRNKGYMTEAVKAVIRHGFEHMGLNRIEAITGVEINPSNKLLRNLGFTEEGILREHYFFNGVLEDSLCFSMLKKEYEKVNWLREG